MYDKKYSQPIYKHQGSHHQNVVLTYGWSFVFRFTAMEYVYMHGYP